MLSKSAMEFLCENLGCIKGEITKNHILDGISVLESIQELGITDDEDMSILEELINISETMKNGQVF